MAKEEHGIELTIGATKAKIGAREYVKATKQVERGADAATKDVRELNTAMDRTKASGKAGAGGLALMHGGYLKLMAAGYALMKFIRVGADFERAMSEVSTIALRGVESVSERKRIMEELTGTARELGATTSFTATQAAEGLLELTKAGYDVEKSQKAIAAVLQVAKASSLDLGTAAGMTADTLNMFGMSADKAEYAMDVLYNTSSSVTTTISELFEAMSKVGPIANAAGMSFEETAAAAGALAEGTLKASIGGTSMRGMLARLLKPTQEVEDALADIGLTAKDVNPQILGWAGTFEVLRDHGMGASDAIKIFGQEAVAGAAVLAKRVDLMRDLTEANKGALGSTKEAAEIMGRVFWGRFQEFGSAAQDLIIEVWDAAGPHITKMVQVWTEGARLLKDAIKPVLDLFKGESEATLDWMNAFEGLEREADKAVSYLSMLFDKLIIRIGSGFETMLGDWKMSVLSLSEVGSGKNAIQKGVEAALKKNPGLKRYMRDGKIGGEFDDGIPSKMEKLLEDADRAHQQRLLEIDARYAQNIIDIEDQRVRNRGDKPEKKAGAGAGAGAKAAETDLDTLLASGADGTTQGSQAVLIAQQEMMIDRIREEKMVVGLTNNEREKELLLREARREALAAGVEEMDQYLAAVSKEIDEMQRLRGIADLAYDMGAAFGTATIDIIEDINSIEQAAEKMMRSLQRIILEHLVARPIAEGVGKLLFSIGSSVAGAITGAAAGGGGGDIDPGGELTIKRGAVFDHGMVRGLASGGIFNVPKYFQSGPDRGVLGEGGIEAAMPLARLADGRLGVLMANGDGGGTTVNQYISTPDADSFRRSQRQIWRKAMSHAGKARM